MSGIGVNVLVHSFQHFFNRRHDYQHNDNGTQHNDIQQSNTLILSITTLNEITLAEGAPMKPLLLSAIALGVVAPCSISTLSLVGANVIKLFTSPQMLHQNKLERISLDNIFSSV